MPRLTHPSGAPVTAETRLRASSNNSVRPGSSVPGVAAVLVRYASMTQSPAAEERTKRRESSASAISADENSRGASASSRRRSRSLSVSASRRISRVMYRRARTRSSAPLCPPATWTVRAVHAEARRVRPFRISATTSGRRRVCRAETRRRRLNRHAPEFAEELSEIRASRRQAAVSIWRTYARDAITAATPSRRRAA